MSRYVNLQALRHAIEAGATEAAKDAGLENVRVDVRILEPDKRGRRVIEVLVTPLTTEQAAAILGRPWEDN